MKRKLCGTLSLLLATSMLLCGCGEKTTDKKDRTDEINGTLGSQTDPTTDNATVNTTDSTTDNVTENTTDSATDGNDFWDGLNPFGEQETLYLLTECVNKNDAGEVLSRYTYTYDDNGLVTSYAYDFPVTESEYDAEKMIFIEHQYPCDGIIDYEAEFSYDRHGSPISVSGDYFIGRDYGQHDYDYEYDDQGKILSYTVIPDDPRRLSEKIEFEYKQDGIIEQWRKIQSREDKLLRTIEMSDESLDRISKIVLYESEGEVTYNFGYDDNGNVTEYWFARENHEPSGKAVCTYDEEGRVILEKGFCTEESTYEYEDGRLVAINGERVEYSESGDGKMVVSYMAYELTYVPIKLKEDQASLARYRWNQFCRGFNSNHNSLKGLYGVKYPVFEMNTVLLLPKGIG